MFNKKKKNEMNMTSGPMLKNIFVFAVPITLTVTLQRLFNSMDMAIVGKFCGEVELAAVGSNWPITGLIINTFMGFSSSSNVVISQLLGAGKEESAKVATLTSLSLAIVLGVVASILGVIFSPMLLKLISSPPEVIGLATIYLRIYFIGIPSLVVYNFAAAILRSRGETTKPLYCLVFGGILNVILNILFVVFFKWSVVGVALATSISNLVSCILVLIVLCNSPNSFKISIKELTCDKIMLSKIIRLGIPISIQASLFPISNIVVQSAVNSLGATIVAGDAIAIAIEDYCFAVMTGFSTAVITFVSQNYGAKNIKRCKKALRETLISSFFVTNTINIIIYTFSEPLLSLFTNDPTVIAIAKQRLLYIFIAFSSSLFLDHISAALKGFGCSVSPTIVSIICVCGLRMAWIATVFSKLRLYTSLLVVYPMTWVSAGIILFFVYLSLVKKEDKRLSG